jgi:hypothetical protein
MHCAERLNRVGRHEPIVPQLSAYQECCLLKQGAAYLKFPCAISKLGPVVAPIDDEHSKSFSYTDFPAGAENIAAMPSPIRQSV